jgi:hypothetical protein
MQRHKRQTCVNTDEIPMIPRQFTQLQSERRQFAHPKAWNSDTFVAGARDEQIDSVWKKWWFRSRNELGKRRMDGLGRSFQGSKNKKLDDFRGHQ